MENEQVISSTIEAVATIAAAVIAARLFRRYEHQKDCLERTKAFRDLFNEFNERFNKLNEDLNKIRDASISKTILPTNYKARVQDYLNLCAEEYLWTREEYQQLIKPEIWAVWKEGIEYYLKVPEIESLFRTELTGSARSSYYGLAEKLGY